VLLSKNFTVRAIDNQLPHYDYKLPFTCIQGDVTDIDFIKKKNEGTGCSGLLFTLFLK